MLKTLASGWGLGLNRTSWLRRAAVLVLATAGVVGIGIWLKSGRPRRASSAAQQASPAESPGVVELSPEKLAAAALHMTTASERMLQHTHRVPGRISYNTARRLELKVPVGGVVKQVLAGPGKMIQRGDRLAILTSVEVGLARDEIVKTEADLQLALKEANWAEQIASNQTTLLKLLETNPAVEEVELQFKDKVLGDHRDKVMSAYSKLVLANRISADTAAMETSGAISKRYVEERRSGREVASAYFKSVCEQSRFEAQQQQAKTRAAVEHVERVLSVNKQRLKLLTGPFAEISTDTTDNTICELILRAPLDGVVEDRLVADGAQFVASQTLFSVANTDTLWVSAQIYERDYAELTLSHEKVLRVQAPAIPDLDVPARVQYQGVSMSNETRAIQLVGEIDNRDHRFKPGMFAWVSVPMEAAHRCLAVPVGALQKHEQEAFVFVEQKPGTYRKVDVTIGLETPDWVEIKSGLAAGANVVDDGGFYLKSELLLREMGDEE